MERGWRDITPNCPRCGSSNTKFCYYNNYSLTQPRYFCKGCRRYWTKGGSLRNVPVGGGCRKSRRSRSSALRLAPSTTTHHTHNGITPSRSFIREDYIVTHNNDAFVHNSYSSKGNLSNMVETSTSPITSEGPSIDLAAVYANYLNQKSDNNDESSLVKLPGEFNHPPNVGFSSIPDATNIVSNTQIVLQVQEEQTNMMVHVNNNSPFSQGLLSNENDQVFFPDMLMQHGVGFLAPLPGDSSILEQSNNDNDQNVRWVSSNQQEAPDAQFSNLFIGSWSPLHLPGFETSSSSSKP